MEMQQKLVKQGFLGVCFAVLLPSPQDQQMHREELKNRVQLSTNVGGVVDPEDALIPDAKLMAGEVVSRLMKFGEAFRWRV